MTVLALEAEALARYFRVLSDPTRLRIVEALLDGERSVSELIAATGAPQSRVSNHLACLRWCEVVTSERQGRSVVYALTDPSGVRELLGLAARATADSCDHLASCRTIGPAWVN